MQLLIKDAMLYGDAGSQPQNVLIENGKITKIGADIQAPDATVLKAEGGLLAPGFTDLHVHLRQPGFEAKETIKTGTAAAAAGGFTTVCSMPNLNPVPDTPQHLRPQLEAIRQDACVRVLPYGALTMGAAGVQPSDIEGLCPDVAGFTDDGRGVQQEDLMRQQMRRAAAVGRFVAAHCEVESLLQENSVCVQQGSEFAKRNGFTGCDNESEWWEVERDIRLSEETGCPLHICHASTKETFELVRQAKNRGAKVTCEVTPHNLLLCCDDITENDGRFKMNPPLRFCEDMEAARRALADGTIDAIATDHAPHTPEDKAPGFPRAANGVVGMETAFAACYTGLVKPGIITLDKLVALMALNPCTLLGEKPPKIQIGASANLVLINLSKEKTVDASVFYGKTHCSPFTGMRLCGWPQLTLYNGNIVFDNRINT